MIDCGILQQLSAHSETIQLRHNPHHDNHTTVARHLLHRDRQGDHVHFKSDQARRACIDTGSLWELSFRYPNGQETHLAAPSLMQCLTLARSFFTEECLAA